MAWLRLGEGPGSAQGVGGAARKTIPVASHHEVATRFRLLRFPRGRAPLRSSAPTHGRPISAALLAGPWGLVPSTCSDDAFAQGAIPYESAPLPPLALRKGVGPLSTCRLNHTVYRRTAEYCSADDIAVASTTTTHRIMPSLRSKASPTGVRRSKQAGDRRPPFTSTWGRCGRQRRRRRRRRQLFWSCPFATGRAPQLRGPAHAGTGEAQDPRWQSWSPGDRGLRGGLSNNVPPQQPLRFRDIASFILPPGLPCWGASWASRWPTELHRRLASPGSQTRQTSALRRPGPTHTRSPTACRPSFGPSWAAGPAATSSFCSASQPVAGALWPREQPCPGHVPGTSYRRGPFSG